MIEEDLLPTLMWCCAMPGMRERQAMKPSDDRHVTSPVRR